MTAPTDLRQALASLSTSLSGITPTNIGGLPDKQDATALADDLRVIARHVDAVILAYGRYARSTLGISQRMVDDCFTDVLTNAIEGNATFILESAGEEIEQAERDIHDDVHVAAHRARLVAAE